MASLQDQLLKAGLVKKEKANQVKKDQQKQAKAHRKMGGKTVNEARLAAQKEQEKKLAKDRELNQRKQTELNQKACMAQIKELIQLNRVDRAAGDIDYSFVYQDKVKKIQVTETMQKQLSLGRLAIVGYSQGKNTLFELVPFAIAEKISQRDKASVIQINQSSTELADGEDPYADYQIPDDLMW